MADEQAQAEDTAVETTPVETQEQTTTEESNGSEAEPTIETENTEESGSGGDLRVALSQEREKRRELEARQNDPQYVYELARKAGLTEEQAQEQAEISQPPTDIGKEVAFQLELAKVAEKYPEIAKDEVLGTSVTALIQKGLSPLKAAEEINKRFGKIKEEAKAEGAAEAKVEITEKEKAQTVQSGANVNSDAAEMESLLQRSKSLNRKESEAAHLELLKRNLKI